MQYIDAFGCATRCVATAELKIGQIKSQCDLPIDAIGHAASSPRGQLSPHCKTKNIHNGGGPP